MDMDLWMAAHGVTVVEVDMPGTMWGCYCLRDHAVVLRPGLTDRQRRAALMHEAQHVLRGDDGHQSQRVEDRIDETVACQMISLMDYARAETEYGWNSGAIAAELDVPKWAVRAYRRILDRAMRESYRTADLATGDHQREGNAS